MKKNIVAAAVIVALASTSVAAQGTDHGSSLGGGGGASGSVAFFGSRAVYATRAVSNNVGFARAAFVNATGGGVDVPSPAGGTVNVPQAAAQALGSAMGGGLTPQMTQTLQAAFGGTAAGNALVDALLALGGKTPSLSTLQAAIAAYNTAITALPGNAPPTPALLGARQALSDVANRGLIMVNPR